MVLKLRLEKYFLKNKFLPPMWFTMRSHIQATEEERKTQTKLRKISYDVAVYVVVCHPLHPHSSVKKMRDVIGGKRRKKRGKVKEKIRKFSFRKDFVAVSFLWFFS